MPNTVANQLRLIWAGQFDILSQADCYARGLHVERDDEVALEFYREAARRSLPGAYLKFAEYLVALPELPRAIRAAPASYFEPFLKIEAETKSALIVLASHYKDIGQFYLGRLFELEERWLEAQNSYKVAAEHGYVLAYYQIAKLYSADRFVAGSSEAVIEKDIAQELLFYKQAAALGCRSAIDSLAHAASDSGEASYYLGQLYELTLYRSYEQSIHYYKQASATGVALASIRLGVIFETGVSGVSPDTTLACNFYAQAFLQGYEEALDSLIRVVECTALPQLQYKLGLLYLQNIRDLTKAVIYFKKAILQGNQEAQAFIEKTAKENGSFAYAIAQAFASELSNPSLKKQSYYYFALAARNGQAEAKRYLESLVAIDDPEAHYILAVHYHGFSKCYEEAIDLCMRAIELDHAEAWHYLSTTQFITPLLLRIATRYEKGEGVVKKLPRAAFFYDAAVKQGDVSAALSLAELYRAGGPLFPINLAKACRYYHYAASHGSAAALDKLRALLEGSSDHDNQFKLAELYFNIARDHEQAIEWYIKSANLGNIKSKQKLQSIATSNADRSFEIAKAYEALEDKKEALFFYYTAAIAGHVAASEYIKTQARLGVAAAQYSLANLYIELGVEESEQAIWLGLAAEQDHADAFEKLRATHWTRDTCLTIAKMYHRGDRVEVNYEHAIEFYEKAYLAGDSISALTLGHLYESQSVKNDKNLDKALYYYQKAAEFGLEEAAEAQRRLQTTVYRLNSEETTYSAGLFRRGHTLTVGASARVSHSTLTGR